MCSQEMTQKLEEIITLMFYWDMKKNFHSKTLLLWKKSFDRLSKKWEEEEEEENEQH